MVITAGLVTNKLLIHFSVITSLIPILVFTLTGIFEASCVALIISFASSGFTLYSSFRYMFIIGVDGIDLASTTGALEYGGKVVEVRPWMDCDKIGYGKDLIPRIMERGCFISENYDKRGNTKWVKTQFQLRNRIISGMSKAVIIIEARPKGGSMRQIEYALKRGKPVLIWKPVTSDQEIHKAYRIYVRRGAIPFNDIHELKEKLWKIIEATTS